MKTGLYIGTSGWSYDHWKDVLYPPGLAVKDRLSVFTSHFNTVELNSSFYHWPRDASFSGWAKRLPEGFRMSVKAPRSLTHAKHLAEPHTWLERIRHGLSLLGARCGVLLVQLPPDMLRDDSRLGTFLKLIPEQIPTTFEFRHPSWHVDPIFTLLEQHGAAYCIMSGANLPCILRATAPFVYIRLHGPAAESLYSGSYPDTNLGWWADRLNEWRAQEHTCWVYFNNDIAGHAVRNATRLTELMQA